MHKSFDRTTGSPGYIPRVDTGLNISKCYSERSSQSDVSFDDEESSESSSPKASSGEDKENSKCAGNIEEHTLNKKNLPEGTSASNSPRSK